MNLSTREMIIHFPSQQVMTIVPPKRSIQPYRDLPCCTGRVSKWIHLSFDEVYLTYFIISLRWIVSKQSYAKVRHDKRLWFPHS